MTTERIKAIVEAKIKDLERRMKKAKYILDTDTLFTKIEMCTRIDSSIIPNLIH
jgi:hypothetical protein